MKALSSPGTSFGSQESGLNRIGAVPNTNKHTIEGSNPIWSNEGQTLPAYDDMMVRRNDPQFDNMSQSSGDSILIGVEDNKAFDNFMNNVVHRNNPLLEQEPIADGFNNPSSNKSTKRPAPLPPPITLSPPPGETDDDDAMNSNFSFGASKLSEL